jgi:hypothetical protein
VSGRAVSRAGAQQQHGHPSASFLRHDQALVSLIKHNHHHQKKKKNKTGKGKHWIHEAVQSAGPAW